MTHQTQTDIDYSRKLTIFVFDFIHDENISNNHNTSATVRVFCIFGRIGNS